MSVGVHVLSDGGIDSSRKLMDMMVTFARTNFEATGQLLPMWHIIDKTGQSYIYMTPFSGDEEKDMTAAFIRAMVKKHDAIRIGFMSETWMAHADSKEAAKHIIPCEQPDRKEALYFICEGIDGTNLCGSIMIERDADDKGHLQMFQEGTSQSGRFTNFFAREKATVH